MTIPSSIQRAAAKWWPITIMVLCPVIIGEAFNLWRKNRAEQRS